MPKKPTMIPDITAIPPVPSIPQLVQEPAIQEPVSPPAETKVTQRLARLVPVKGFPIRHFNGGIVFYPGVPSAEIPLDAWLENQIKRGVLVEV